MAFNDKSRLAIQQSQTTQQLNAIKLKKPKANGLQKKMAKNLLIIYKVYTFAPLKI